MRLSLRFRHDESGSALTETVICISGLLFLLLGMMDCARAVYVSHYVSYSARAAAHYAMVRGSTFTGTSCTTPSTANCAATSANITSFVKNLAPAGVSTGSPLTVTPSWPGTTVTGSACASTNGNNSPGCVVKVHVAYTFNFIFPFMPGGNLTFQSNSAMTVAQ